MKPPLYPCACCGYPMFAELPGSYDICAICFWEDDAVQLRWPTLEGGANAPSLIDSQRNFMRFSAMEERFAGNVRAPAADEARDPGWRPFDPEKDRYLEPFDKSVDHPKDWTHLYWWRPTYWLAQPSANESDLNLGDIGE